MSDDLSQLQTHLETSLHCRTDAYLKQEQQGPKFQACCNYGIPSEVHVVVAKDWTEDMDGDGGGGDDDAPHEPLVVAEWAVVDMKTLAEVVAVEVVVDNRRHLVEDNNFLDGDAAIWVMNTEQLVVWRQFPAAVYYAIPGEDRQPRALS